jgi:NAD dependent epimerase/dehydratase family
MTERRDTVIITGSSGFIGEALLGKLAASFRIIGLDRRPPRQLLTNASFEEIDLTSDESVAVALAKIGKRRPRGIASVIHLAAYFDLTGATSCGKSSPSSVRLIPQVRILQTRSCRRNNTSMTWILPRKPGRGQSSQSTPTGAITEVQLLPTVAGGSG